MPLDYEILVNFSLVFQVVFFVATVALIRRFHRPGLLPLLALALTFLVGKANDLWQQTGLILEFPDWIFSLSLIVILLGPFIYLYVLERTQGRVRPRLVHAAHALWILPPAAYLAVNWWPIDSAAKITLLKTGGLETLTALVLLPVYFDAILVVYLAVSVARLRSHGIRLQNWFSNIEDRNLSGIRHLLTMFAIMIVLHLLWTIGRYFFWEGALSSWVVNTLVTYHLVLINGLFLEFVTHRHAPNDPGEPDLQELRGSSRPPAGLSEQERASLLENLADLMRRERPHLDPDLTVAQLAKPLHVHARVLSQLINSGHGCNFLEFINRHRIEHAKAELADHPEKSILDVAYDSGFNSKSTFNTAFKRFVELTPSGFRRSLDEQA